MEVVIVDDSREEREKISQAIGTYFKNIITLDPQDITSKFYTDYDIYFLDIEMEPCGQDIAKRINELHPQAILIFMTHHPFYIFETQIYNPFYFIRKSHFEEDLQIAMEMLNHDQKRFLTISTHQQKTFIEMKSILYIEIYRGMITIHTQEKEISYWGTFKELMKQLSSQFLRIHQSYIINIDHVENLSNHEVIIHQKSLPVSRKYHKEVKDVLGRRETL